MRGAPGRLEVQPGSAAWALEHGWIVESSRAGWRLGCASELWAPSFNHPPPQKTHRGEPPPAEEVLALPRGSGTAPSVTCCVPLPRPRCSLSQGASWGRGEKWKSVENAPGTRAQPCVGCEQPPSTCLARRDGREEGKVGL